MALDLMFSTVIITMLVSWQGEDELDVPLYDTNERK